MNQLRARVIAILVAAALPAIMLVAALAYQTYDTTRASALDSLQRDAALLATRFDALPLAAVRMSTMFATTAAWDPQLDEHCQRNIEPILPTFTSLAGILIYRESRLMCSTGFPFAHQRAATLAQLNLADLAAGKSLNGTLPDVNGEQVIFGASRGDQAASEIVAVLTIDNGFLAQLLGFFRSFDSSKALLLDRQGRSFGALDRTLSSDDVPKFPPLANAPPVSIASDMLGRSYVITTQKLSAPEVWLVTYQREADVLESARRQLIVSVAAPILTLVLVGLATWLGLTRFVLAWITRLTRVTNAYACGDLRVRVGDASSAPSEIAQLAGRFDSMADRMAERAIELEKEVAERRRYIRELHHRVKNNLQVIASLLALQKRSLTGDHRNVLRFPEDRVNAMAAAYGVSYAQTESGRVGVLSVVREVVTRLQSGVENGHSHVRVTIAGEDREVDLDTAIGIAMLLAEYLPPFLDQSIDGAHMTTIDATFADGRLVMKVSGPQSESPGVSPLSGRFARAYVRQLNADVEASVPGRLILRIPAPKPTAALVAAS